MLVIIESVMTASCVTSSDVGFIEQSSHYLLLVLLCLIVYAGIKQVY